MCCGRNKGVSLFTVVLVLAALAVPASVLAMESKRESRRSILVRGQQRNRILIVSNLKMKNAIPRQRLLADVMAKTVAELDNGVVAGIAPTDTAMSLVKQTIDGRHVALGAQNVHHKAKGSVVGESSVLDASFVDATYVIVGHSNRREKAPRGATETEQRGETDALVNLKAHLVQEHRMVPVICVGETIEQREAGKTIAVVSQQVKTAKAGLKLGKTVWAYEPVWAIGTGKVPTPEEAQEVHGVIRGLLEAEAPAIRILYGGSFDDKNGPGFLAMPDIDGALVATASFDPKVLRTMLQQGAKARRK